MTDKIKSPKSSLRNNITIVFFLIIIIWGVSLTRIFQELLQTTLVKEGLDEIVIESITRNFITLSTGFTLVALFIVLFVALFFSKAITRPIKKLTEGVVEVARGRLGVKVEVASEDEFGQLADSFNKMAEDLKHHIEKEKELAAQAAAAEVEKKRAEDLDRAYKELRDMQEKVIRSEKLAALGKLAGVVGHELRNPLSVIRNSIYFLRMKLDETTTDEKIKKHMDIIDEEIDISNRIITDILTFGRVKEPQLAKININDVVKVSLGKVRMPENVEVVIKLKGNLPEILADQDQLIQVFFNIIMNAVQAMPGEGTLTVASSTKNGVIEVAIIDTGEGIARENLEKIFEPLFSTKIKGTGLGLSVCESIIEGHKGTVEVESEAGEGAKIIVVLPITKKGG